MKESAAPLRDGSPHTECMSDWLLSYQLNLSSLQRRAWRGQTRNKGFPNNTQSQIGAFGILRHYNAAGLPQISSFFTFPPCQLNLFTCSMRQRKYSHSCFSKQTRGTVLAETAEGGLSVCNSRVKRQAWKSCKESSSCVLKPGSAFAKVHFCISEHTNPSACSNSLQLSLRQLMTTAQQQHCLISNVFLNLGCQGSLVGGCLLYFSYKKVFFPLRQWLIQRPRRRELCQQELLKLQFPFVNFQMALALLLPAAHSLYKILG